MAIGVKGMDDMTIEDLKQYGADTEQGLQRCMNNEAFYLRLVKMAAGDANFDRLFASAGSGMLGEAFEAAHALKGTAGNLALTPIYRPVCEITEMLREKKETDYSALVQVIREEREKLLGICGE